jgi:hypothetical protein
VTLAVSLTGGHNVPICGQLHNAKKACKKETEGIADKVFIQQPDKDNNREMIHVQYTQKQHAQQLSADNLNACWIFARRSRIIR